MHFIVNCKDEKDLIKNTEKKWQHRFLFFNYNPIEDIREVFQKYAERFHRMFAIAARLMIFHVKHAWYTLIKYR